MALKLSLLPTDQKTDAPPELDLAKVKVMLAGLKYSQEPVDSARTIAAALIVGICSRNISRPPTVRGRSSTPCIPTSPTR